MSNWDLKFAIRIDKLNARLAEGGTLPAGMALSASDPAGSKVTASLKTLQIIEVAPGTTRNPGPTGTLAIQMTIGGLQLSGPAVPKLVALDKALQPDANGALNFPQASLTFQVSLRFLKMSDGGTGLVFAPLPDNQQAVTAKVDQDGSLDAACRVLIAQILDTWLKQNLDKLSPAFALFGKDGLTLGPLSYSYMQSPNAGEDIICVYAMLGVSTGTPPPVETMLPDFVEDGKAAFLLSVPALMNTAIAPATNAFAKSEYHFGGDAFSYNAVTQTLALAQGVSLQTGTISSAGQDCPVNITQFSIAYGNFDGTDGLQLSVTQSSNLKTTKTYCQGGKMPTCRVLVVDWCSIYRQQSDVMDMKVGQGPQGAQAINFVPRDNRHIDKSWSVPADNSTGQPVLDMILRFFQGASDSLALFLGPPGIVIFIVKLALTTLGDVLNSYNIQNAKDRTKSISPGSIISSIKFEWGGIGDINYTSAKLAGGLKIVGS